MWYKYCVFRENTYNRLLPQSQSYDEYYDSNSYVYQEERYGPEEEDRQWDSGGPYQNTTQNRINHENYQNKRRNSQLPQVGSYPNQYPDDTYVPPPTTTTRRRMPQIPTRRANSRQGSLQDGYDECRTPENSSHRGASLPPTPTTTPKLLARIAATQNKPSASLPPTPGRQLPKPNLNHRSAKNRRNGLLKRTISADYSPEHNGVANAQNADQYEYYMKPGAVNTENVYNEDYNYAYESIDNLPTQVAEQTDAHLFVHSTVNTMPVYSTIITTHNQADVTPTNTTYTSPKQLPNTVQDNYYNDNYYTNYNDHNQYEDKSQINLVKKKLIGRRENSPLLQQNTDSLESRDDDLKDSFETAVSTESSSLPLKRNQTMFSSIENSTLDTTTTSANSFITPSTILPSKTVSTTQYNRDQTDSTKAIMSINGSNLVNGTDVTTSSASRLTGPHLIKQPTSIDKGYFNHQDSVDQTEYNDQEISSTLNDQNYIKTDTNDSHYLTQQESVDSYTEEMNMVNGNDYANNIGKESPVSVIHVESYEPNVEHTVNDDDKLRETQSHSLMDPYHPAHQIQDPYAPVRRPSIDPHRATSPSRRTSGDSYIMPTSRRGSFNEQYNNTAHRKSSNLDPYPVSISRRTSVRHSPNQEMMKQTSMDQVTPTGSIEEHDQEKKSVSFEEEEEVKPVRREITAKQRWHWAYNKIIMQLNVSIN